MITPTTVIDFNRMPTEMFLSITSSCDAKTLCKLGETSKRLHILVTSCTRWRDLVRIDWPLRYEAAYSELPVYISFYEIYAIEAGQKKLYKVLDFNFSDKRLLNVNKAIVAFNMILNPITFALAGPVLRGLRTAGKAFLEACQERCSEEDEISNDRFIENIKQGFYDSFDCYNN